MTNITTAHMPHPPVALLHHRGCTAHAAAGPCHSLQVRPISWPPCCALLSTRAHPPPPPPAPPLPLVPAATAATLPLRARRPPAPPSSSASPPTCCRLCWVLGDGGVRQQLPGDRVLLGACCRDQGAAGACRCCCCFGGQACCSGSCSCCGCCCRRACRWFCRAGAKEEVGGETGLTSGCIPSGQVMLKRWQCGGGRT